MGGMYGLLDKWDGVVDKLIEMAQEDKVSGRVYVCRTYDDGELVRGPWFLYQSHSRDAPQRYEGDSISAISELVRGLVGCEPSPIYVLNAGGGGVERLGDGKISQYGPMTADQLYEFSKLWSRYIKSGVPIKRG